jgi:hypothetical protein
VRKHWVRVAAVQSPVRGGMNQKAAAAGVDSCRPLRGLHGFDSSPRACARGYCMPPPPGAGIPRGSGGQAAPALPHSWERSLKSARPQRIISPRWTAGVMAMVVAPGIGKPDWVMPTRQNRFGLLVRRGFRDSNRPPGRPVSWKAVMRPGGSACLTFGQRFAPLGGDRSGANAGRKRDTLARGVRRHDLWRGGPTASRPCQTTRCSYGSTT